MHARLMQPGPAEGGRGIRGTFYPSEESAGARSIGPALGKVAELHRELHTEDAPQAEVPGKS